MSAVLAALLFAAPSATQARVINAASPSLTEVRRALASAADGDTVIVPAGTASWTSGLTITKAITIQGQTTTDIANGTANDQTVIVDNLVRVAGAQPFFNFTANSGQQVRITGITFTGQGGQQQAMANGAINVGTSVPFRIDHCHFTYLAIYPDVAIYRANGGVADHNVFDHYVLNGFSISVNFGSQDSDWGDGSWTRPTGFGGPDFFFIEDNYIYNDLTGSVAAGGVDSFFGGKYVFRHNRVWNALTFSHSTGSDWPRGRGTRAKEIYNNEYHFTSSESLSGTTGGPLLAHDNTFYGTLPTGWNLQVYRAIWSYGAPFNGADGTSPWDVNDSHGLYESGNATSATNTSITDTSKNWTANQWVGYSVKRPSDGATALVTANNANTLQMASWQAENWTGGNRYEIRKVLVILDQPCRGQGDLINVNHPAWPNQQLEPCYSWNNVHSPGGEHLNLTRAAGDQTLLQGRDYFTDTPMPGYTPYTYPHPLVTGATGEASRAVVADFNGDGSPDLVLHNPGTHQTAIWYLNNNVWIGSAYGPTLPNNWGLRSATDFNGDSHSDYALFNSATGQTGIWYLSGPTLFASAYGPSLPSGWELVATADFNGDGHPDYVLYNAGTRQTAIWYMNNNVRIGSAYGLTLPPGWNLIGVADFNGDGHPDYAAVYSSTGQTAIGYLSGLTLVGVAAGPISPSGWAVVATGDFNGDGKPDFVLYNSSTRQTAIWYLNDNVWIGSAYGPTVPFGWSLISP